MRVKPDQHFAAVLRPMIGPCLEKRQNNDRYIDVKKLREYVADCVEKVCCVMIHKVGTQEILRRRKTQQSEALQGRTPAQKGNVLHAAITSDTNETGNCGCCPLEE